MATTPDEYHEFLTERLLVSIAIACGGPGAQQLVDGLQQRYTTTLADAEGTWLVQTGHLAYQSGTLGQMIHAVQAMTTAAQPRMWAGALAVALMWAGEPDRAAEVLGDDTDLPRNYFWLPVTQARAETAAGLGLGDHCRRIYAELLPFRGRFGVTGAGSMCFGLVSRTLGMLSLALDEPARAEEFLTEAVDHADRIGAVHEGVASRRLLATALLATGEPDRALAHMEAALPIAVDRGFDRDADLIRTSMAAARLGTTMADGADLG